MSAIDEAPGVVAMPARLTAWAEVAKAGDRFVYATRCALPPGSAGAACARTLEAQGLVYLSRKRVDSLTGTHSYFAERSSRAWPESSSAGKRPVGEVDIVAEVERLAIDKLLPLLTRTARFGRPCPHTRQLAERLECEDALVPAAMDALKSMGLIIVERAAMPTNRRVVILETGFRTGLAA